MSTREKLIKARLGMLALAEDLQSISLACRRAGISRSHFYEIREACEKYGAEGLAPRSRRRPRMPNETPPELEGKILEMTEPSRGSSPQGRRAQTRFAARTSGLLEPCAAGGGQLLFPPVHRLPPHSHAASCLGLAQSLL